MFARKCLRYLWPLVFLPTALACDVGTFVVAENGRETPSFDERGGAGGGNGNSGGVGGGQAGGAGGGEAKKIPPGECIASRGLPPAKGSIVLGFVPELTLCVTSMQGDRERGELSIQGLIQREDGDEKLLERIELSLALPQALGEFETTIECSSGNVFSASCHFEVTGAGDDAKTRYEALSRTFKIDVAAWNEVEFIGRMRVTLLETTGFGTADQATRVFDDVLLSVDAALSQ